MIVFILIVALVLTCFRTPIYVCAWVEFSVLKILLC